MENPEPLTPPDADLQGFGFMPFYGHRLFGSDFNSRCNDTEWRAGVTLWWAAWNQVPAGSLPDDEAALARLADLGRDVRTWRKIRERALHGFIKCSDGRLYHKALAPLVIEAWDRRIAEREKKRKWREKRAAKIGAGDRDETGTDTGTEPGRDGLVPVDRDRERDRDRREEEDIKFKPSQLPREMRGPGAPLTADPKIRKQVWEQGVVTHLCQSLEAPEAAAAIESYERGEPEGKRIFNDIDRAMKAGKP